MRVDLAPGNPFPDLRLPEHGEVPEVGADLGRSAVDGRPWVVRRIEEADGRTAIHISKE